MGEGGLLGATVRSSPILFFFLLRNDGGVPVSGGSDPVRVDDATHVTAQ